MVSVIIPTFGRPLSVVLNTLNSMGPEANEIILIDQNVPPLNFNQTGLATQLETLDLSKASERKSSLRILHLTGLLPSVTRAKNKGVKFAKNPLLVFFDDDVTVLPGCVARYVLDFEQHPEIAYLGGRETLDQNVKKEGRFKRYLRFLANRSRESEYQVNGQYIGRIKPNSFMIKNFDVEALDLVKIDGARGCNWACRKDWFDKAGGFDEHYQGTALREETDLYLRINALGGKGYYESQARVIHHRQAGGCDNLSDSIKSLNSKFTNELYFQNKFFANRSRIYFLIRTLPLVIETLRESKGISILIWLKYGFKLGVS